MWSCVYNIKRESCYCSHDVRPATHLAILNRLWRWGEMHSSQNMHPPCQSAEWLTREWTVKGKLSLTITTQIVSDYRMIAFPYFAALIKSHLFFLLLTENNPKYFSDNRSCEAQLPEECHWEIEYCCLEPHSNHLISCILKEQCCCKAHQRAHSNDG